MKLYKFSSLIRYILTDPSEDDILSSESILISKCEDDINLHEKQKMLTYSKLTLNARNKKYE